MNLTAVKTQPININLSNVISLWQNIRFYCCHLVSSDYNYGLLQCPTNEITASYQTDELLKSSLHHTLSRMSNTLFDLENIAPVLCELLSTCEPSRADTQRTMDFVLSSSFYLNSADYSGAHLPITLGRSLPWVSSHRCSHCFCHTRPHTQYLTTFSNSSHSHDAVSFVVFDRCQRLLSRYSPILRSTVLLHQSHQTTQLLSHRTFKSYRNRTRSQSLESQLSANQHLYPREGATQNSADMSNISADQLRLIRTHDSNNEEMFGGKNTETNSTLDWLNRNKSVSDEKHRLRVAFAEGYAVSAINSRRQDNSSSKQSHQSSARTPFFPPWLSSLGSFLLRASAVFLIVIGISLLLGPARNLFQISITSNEISPEEVNVTFKDVKGVDEAKQELQDIVSYLRDPERFTVLGGRLPSGVLLTGAAGTGKTLLAKAVAGEASVPFFYTAGSEFDEVFVGQGARRVRELFRMAKLRAPCVVFIDEIDSVGGKRSASRMHPYANQTINQLLTEMDGFRSNEGVIVIGATNRKDHLDSALLRPGRFDVIVQVNPPDYNGRKQIFELYLEKILTSEDVSSEKLSRGTTGFTGAEIENVVNQAALHAASLYDSQVSMSHLEWARDKILMGVERKHRVNDETTNRTTAYHEGGHTLVAYLTRLADPVHKVTIVPRSASLGHTSQLPDKDQYQVTKAEIMAKLDVLMGGRAAEELIFGSDNITSGASNDLEKATMLATRMVRLLGMSDKIGVRTISDETGEDYLPIKSVSDNTMEQVDAEIKRLLQESYNRALNLLKQNINKLHTLAEALLQHETLDSEDLEHILGVRNRFHPDK